MNNLTKSLLAMALSAVGGVALAAGAGAGAGGSGGASGGMSGGAHGGAQASSFTQLDADSDGAISQQEASAMPGLNFTSADVDGDGKLTKSEFEAAVKNQQQRGGSPTPSSPGQRPGAGGPGGSTY